MHPGDLEKNIYQVPGVAPKEGTEEKGAPAGPNPWNARGLEWTTDSPPPKENFREIPTVTDEPYAYDPEHPER